MSNYPLMLCLSGGVKLLIENIATEAGEQLLRELYPYAQIGHSVSLPDSVVRLRYGVHANRVESGFLPAVRISSNPDIFIVECCERSREELFRTIRDIYLVNLRRKGFSFFHASMVAMHSQGILFLGNKRAGKTTMMLEMARLQKFDIVANDKIAISDLAPSACLGLPVKAGIRKSLFESVKSEIAHFSSDGQRHFASMQEIASAYGVSLIPKANVRMIVCPKYQDSAIEATIRPAEDKKWRERYFERGAYNLLELDECINGDYSSTNLTTLDQFAANLSAFELIYSDSSRDEAARAVSTVFESTVLKGRVE